MAFDPYTQAPAFGYTGGSSVNPVTGYSNEPPVDPYTGRRGDLEYQMTPRPKITSTGFGALPSKENGGETWTWGDNPHAAERTKQAIREAWESRGDWQDPAQREAAANASGIGGWLSRNISAPVIDTAVGALKAVGAGVGATASEVANAVTGNPAAGRDVTALMQTVPAVAAAAAPVMPGALTRYPQPGKRFVPGGERGPVTEAGLAEAEERVRRAEFLRNTNRALTGEKPDVGTSPTQLTYKEGAIPGAPIVERVAPTTEPYSPPLSPATIGSDAREIAKGHFDVADRLGGRVGATANDKYLDERVSKIRTQSPEARRFDPNDAVDASIADLNNALRGQDLSLQGTMEIDRKIGDRIGKALNAGSRDEASRLIELQHSLRDHVESVGQSEVTGGPEGFAALKKAREAWAISVRMQDVERIIEESTNPGVANPQAVFRSKIGQFLKNDKLTRGWSEADLDMLRAAAKTGNGMEIMRMMGSRLGPIGGYVMGGPVGGLAVGAGEAILANKMRNALGGIYAGRLERLVQRMGERVPGAGTGGVPAPPGLLGRLSETTPGVALGGLVLEPPEDRR